MRCETSALRFYGIGLGVLAESAAEFASLQSIFCLFFFLLAVVLCCVQKTCRMFGKKPGPHVCVTCTRVCSMNVVSLISLDICVDCYFA